MKGCTCGPTGGTVGFSGECGRCGGALWMRGLVSFDDHLKQLYGRDGQPTAEGKEMLARMDAERAERNKDIAGLIDERGRLTLLGRDRILELSNAFKNIGMGHLDNTGASCRVDLDGHDCCSTCNAAEDMLRATAKYYEGR